MPPAVVPKPLSAPLAADLDRLYREHHALVFRTAWGVLGSRDDAEDVVQSVFLALARRASPPDLTQNPRAYLYKAAVTASLDVLKAQRRHEGRLKAASVSAPAMMSFDEELYERLYAAIASLDAAAASVILLRYQQDKSLGDIARELGLSRTAVAVRLFRARARLRALLATEHDHEDQ
jgi:RNA polymerase sigma-70 factor (ECF subfamily)